METDDTGAESTPTQASLGFEWMTPDERDWAERAMIRQDTIRDTLTGEPTATTDITNKSTLPVAKVKAKTSTTKVPKVSVSKYTKAVLGADSAIPSVPSLSEQVPDTSEPPPLIARGQSVVEPSPAPSGLRRSTRSTKGVFNKLGTLTKLFSPPRVHLWILMAKLLNLHMSLNCSHALILAQ
jgi:hypothetical protein